MSSKWIYTIAFLAVFFYQFHGVIFDLWLAASAGLYVWQFKSFSEKPIVNLKSFGLETLIFDDDTIKPFIIKIPEFELNNLKEKLSRTRELTPPLKGAGFHYGSNSEYMKVFLDYWKTEYNWKKREPYLNQFPQFTTQIGGLNIHFIHAKPNETARKGIRVLPLLLIHGWPGSIREFYKLIPKLTTPRKPHDFVFEVIAPSIPGNGFSEAAQVTGLDAAQISVMFHHLMHRLGFEEYYIHASDSGALIGQSQAILFPEWILGYHSNMCIAVNWASLIFIYLSIRIPFLFLDEAKQDTFNDHLWNLQQELGFFQVISTKPDTLGIALSDSPIGLAALILEKFSTWSNYKWKPRYDGGLDTLDKNDLLDIIMIYWLTNSITPSIRMWKETFKQDSDFISNALMMRKVEVPSGCVWFSREISYTPLWALEQAFPKLMTLNYLKEGGHFPAIEKPTLLSEDIWKFVETERIFGVLKYRPKNFKNKNKKDQDYNFKIKDL